jgi:pyridoxamine 5'-phosphate oxidase family protein
MATFSDNETSFINAALLGRLATVGDDGTPHVMPVGVWCDPEAGTLVIGGHGLARSKKWRDLRARPGVAVVVDDLATVDPWRPRGIEVRGVAETHEEGGAEAGRRVGASFPFEDAWIEVHPRRIVAWGIDQDAAQARDVA